ncbi:putative phosphoglycerate mutase [Saccharothrix tamanrassetensis]|uniref:Putative phosphoglycerate mutase n=1 Tax=Saccharothrix tamanrassetensis TaxID=1051531 RepID=A0A841CRR8_9PSEU|nr:histidine phosphatase family protein [Saccharothrix tamanrassetensis]MBB5958838.1 putative phosphoglycerate mutase [Saccharothrix tamanrassetensis]
MKLILVRHGETASNLKMALDSLPPGPPLTEAGVAQAAALASSLAADESVAAVYASTAVRAQQTAAPVAAAFGLEVEVLEGVQEIFCGDLEGRHDREAFEIFLTTVRSWAEGDLDLAIPGGESGRRVIDRFVAAVDKVAARHAPDDTFVLVSHGGSVRMAALALARNVQPALAEAGLLPNTGRVVLEDSGAGWTCTSWTGVDAIV